MHTGSILVISLTVNHSYWWVTWIPCINTNSLFSISRLLPETYAFAM